MSPVDKESDGAGNREVAESEGSGQSSDTVALAFVAVVLLQVATPAKVAEPHAALCNNMEDSEDEVDMTRGAKPGEAAHDASLSPMKRKSDCDSSSSSSSSNGSSGSHGGQGINKHRHSDVGLKSSEILRSSETGVMEASLPARATTTFLLARGSQRRIHNF